jgi:hypothetical protein
MPGPIRPWNGAPPDMSDPTINAWATWITNAVNQGQGPLFAPQPPLVTTVSHPNAVQVCWNEVQNTTSYAVFESDSQSAPPGLPFATVSTNAGGNSNSVLRGSITDTTTRYYFVQAINETAGLRSQLSAPAPGAALAGSAPTIPVSTAPLNQGGVGGGTGGGGGITGIRFNRGYTP